MQETRFCMNCNNDERTNNGKTENNKNGLCSNCQRCCSSTDHYTGGWRYAICIGTSFNCADSVSFDSKGVVAN